MYIVTAHKTGKFKILDTYHHKVVFRGKDCRMKSRAGTSYEFASSDDMLATLHRWMSTSTYCKLVQALRS